MKLTARNVIKATVEKITHDTVESEIGLRLEGGVRLVSLIPRRSAECLGLAPGSSAYVVIPADKVSIEIE